MIELELLIAQDLSLRILKPWWDILFDYFNLLLVLVSVLSTTLQASSEKMLCMPIPPNPLVQTVINLTSSPGVTTYFFPSGHQTKMDLQSYYMINQWCYEHVISDYSRLFPYFMIVNATFFWISSYFWFTFPGTRSKIEQFITNLGMCLTSPWTIEALSRTVHEKTRIRAAPLEIEALQTKPESKTLEMKAEAQSPIMTSVSGLENIKQPLTTNQPEDPPKAWRKQVHFQVEEAKRTHVPYRRSKKRIKAITGTRVSILDKKEREKAKALFERVKKFRLHTEQKSVLYYTYQTQVIIRLLLATTLVSYSTYQTSFMKYEFHCVEPQKLSGYTEFKCVYLLWRMFTVFSIVYLLVLSIYIFICLYIVYWTLSYKLQEYSFKIIRKESGLADILDAKNDFAFLLHLVDQYDQLYTWEFAVFLSDGPE